MFQSTPKEKCCLWGLWFSDCNSDCWLLRNTYLRGMEKKHSMEFLFVNFPLYCRKDKSEQISNLIWLYSAEKFGYVEGAQHKFSKLSKSARPACLMSCHLGGGGGIGFLEAIRITSKLSKEPYSSSYNESLDSHDWQRYIRCFHFTGNSRGPRMVSFCWSYLASCFANCKHSVKW